jgi:hypothetical protein
VYPEENYTHTVVLCQGRNQGDPDKDYPEEWNIFYIRTMAILMTCTAKNV